MMGSVKEEASKENINMEQIRVVICSKEMNKRKPSCVKAECTGSAPVDTTSSTRTELDLNVQNNEPCMELNCEKGKVKLSNGFDSKDEKVFHFAHVFNGLIDHKKIYNKCCADVVQSAIDGGCSTVIGYGTSRSGKSDTLHGSSDGHNKGMIQLASQQIFTTISNLQHQGESVFFVS